MLIVSRHKDYYDYLQGIYGVDDKLILDRTKFHHEIYAPSEHDVALFYICNFRVEGVFIGGKWLYGDEIFPYALTKDYGWYASSIEKGINYYLRRKNAKKWDTFKILKKPLYLDRPDNPNLRLECPILKHSSRIFNGYPLPAEDFLEYPILKEYEMHKVFPPEEIYKMLSEWLGQQKNVQIPDNQSDKEKIISHGFDNKTSFRKM